MNPYLFTSLWGSRGRSPLDEIAVLQAEANRPLGLPFRERARHWGARRSREGGPDMTIKAFGQDRLSMRRPVKRLRPAGCWTVIAALGLIACAVAGDTWAGELAHPGDAQRIVAAAAVRSAVPPELALAVARMGRDPRFRDAGAPRAMGVMQVLPSVARAEFGIHAYGLRDARANAGIGMTLLERLYRRHGERWDLALSHYRGGPLPRCGNGPVAHAHTMEYVAGVMEWWRRHQKDETVAALMAGAAADASAHVGPGFRAGSGRTGGTRTRSLVNGAAWTDVEGRFRSHDRPGRGHGRPRRFL